ncbi:MAG: hypothetical protein MRERC_6c042 [Mycoplasmataceae bacterium RC_NB112A]|nr:MAG: hypothetical protein MRERC_13c044 [Mycoplasmataceae bacterium RC_NB112A]KLL01954.1 MAG: hypothetical protein MRERC_6c042 [Mycoplasmataceae bacterium RC_NB112A]
MDTKKKNNSPVLNKIENELDKESFKTIKEMFNQYWKILFLLITVYIFSYMAWHFLLRNYILSDNGLGSHKGKLGWGFVVSVAAIRGLLFGLDGWVTSLLKTPFNQMCYTINKTEGIRKEKKNYIISKATESNEHCKETLKKFGILNIGVELIAVGNFFVSKNLNKPFGKEGIESDYEKTLYISYLIPLVFSAFSILLIYLELKKIESQLARAKQKRTKEKANR